MRDRRFWILSLLYMLGAAAVIGVPTVLIPTPFFARMTPTSLRDYVIWALSVPLLGPLLALTTLYPVSDVRETLRHIGNGNWRAGVGGTLSLLSVGCPVCNKIVVVVLGVTGAMTLFDPLRPALGVAALGVLAVTLTLRIRAVQRGCSLAMTDRFPQRCPTGQCPSDRCAGTAAVSEAAVSEAAVSRVPPAKEVM